MRKKKKAQIIGQAFIYILAGLIFTLIIAYGYNAIQYFLEKQEQVILLDFKTSLETAIETTKTQYGTVKKLTLKLPQKYQGICFLDPETCTTQTPQLQSTQTTNLPWAQEACTIKTANTFIIPRQDINLPNIQIDPPGNICIPNQNGITIKLEGTGKKTKISTW
jgi:hypothetical protein